MSVRFRVFKPTTVLFSSISNSQRILGKYNLIVLAISFLCLGGCGSENSFSRIETTISGTPSGIMVEEAISEIDISLNHLFEMIDNRNVDVLINATRHAARGRVLLEKVLGDDVDNFDPQMRKADPFKGQLILISNQARKFSSQQAADLWLHNLSTSYYSDATGELAILDVMLKGFKATYF